MAEPKAAGTKTTYFIELPNNKVAKIKAKKTSVSAVATSLGWDESATGEVPNGKTLVGSGTADALLNGCFPIALYYSKSGKDRRAVVLCSPTKADTIAAEAKTKTYLGQDIIRVSAVRRRKFTY
ncbi:hypothetical protein [Anabaena sp. PCC 7108]|uniref:hypothetical protein n=1 Tax=Anabaena sp. PCC 7108 TaxID=163908 RepID=UPI000346E7AC|nr:hypothetical protein [Anabaena sp. PCC 7108]